MNELVIAAIPLAGLAAGWVVNKQLAVNRQVAENTEAIKSLKGDSTYTRDRVDDIHNFLLNSGSRTRRGSSE